MIHVQIASQLTVQGVSGVRWVLVEAMDLDPVPGAPAAALAAEATASAAETAAQPVGSAAAGALRLGALKLLVVGLGLGAALWTAHVQVGPPGARPVATPALPAQTAPLHPGATPIAPPSPETRARPAAPGAAAPAASGASASLPRLTAAL